jgi:hypothetical protein
VEATGHNRMLGLSVIYFVQINKNIVIIYLSCCSKRSSVSRNFQDSYR